MGALRAIAIGVALFVAAVVAVRVHVAAPRIPVLTAEALCSLSVALAASWIAKGYASARGRSVAGLRLSTCSTLVLAAAIPLVADASSLLGEAVVSFGDKRSGLAVFPGWGMLTPVVFFAIAAPAGALSRVPPAEALRMAKRVGSVLIAFASIAVAAGAVGRVRHLDPAAMAATSEHLGSVTFTRTPDGANGDAYVAALRDGSRARLLSFPVEGGRLCETMVVEDTATGEQARLPCETEIWRIRATGLWVVGRFNGRTGEVVARAFIPSALTEHGATFASFAHELAPPLTWTLSALVGLVVALASLVPRDRWMHELLTWREELVGGVPSLVNPASAPTGYRERIDPESVVRYTHALVREHLARVALDRWMFAIAAVTLMGAPLFTAVVMGFI